MSHGCGVLCLCLEKWRYMAGRLGYSMDEMEAKLRPHRAALQAWSADGDAKERYLELVTELLILRGDPRLTDEEEARYMDEFERCWWAMSESDRTEVERAIGGADVPRAKPITD